MSDPEKDLLEALSKIEPKPKRKSEMICTACGIALYPAWGLLSSALLLNSNFLRNQLLSSVAGIGFAGLLPVALHFYEVWSGKTCFEWKTVFICLSFGGILTLFLGCILQAVLLFFGVQSIAGLRIDTWSWKFPYWMQNGY